MADGGILPSTMDVEAIVSRAKRRVQAKRTWAQEAARRAAYKYHVAVLRRSTAAVLLYLTGKAIRRKAR